MRTGHRVQLIFPRDRVARTDAIRHVLAARLGSSRKTGPAPLGCIGTTSRPPLALNVSSTALLRACRRSPRRPAAPSRRAAPPPPAGVGSRSATCNFETRARFAPGSERPRKQRAKLHTGQRKRRRCSATTIAAATPRYRRTKLHRQQPLDVHAFHALRHVATAPAREIVRNRTPRRTAARRVPPQRADPRAAPAQRARPAAPAAADPAHARAAAETSAIPRRDRERRPARSASTAQPVRQDEKAVEESDQHHRREQHRERRADAAEDDQIPAALAEGFELSAE